ncbi:MAG: GAF domain-containing protein [Chloroflexi bacterium]|nr:GAF domain-containing protein [Chloroflexota bacterium]
MSQAVDAEAAECFLVEPKSRDMLLTACHGPFRSAFSQITRFHPGAGFPGLVSSREAPLVTQNLRLDPRYLRTRVKDKGFLSYVCVPLSGPSGVMGTLNVAARRPNFDVERALRFLTWASRPISTALQGGLLQNRERMSSASLGALLDTSRGMDGLLQAVLSNLILIGNATGGVLALYDRQVGGLVHLVKQGEVAAAVCPRPNAQEPQMCPALAHGRGEALYGPRSGWPVPCCDAPARGAVAYCLPLLVGSERLGIVQLGYGGRAPSPPTKYLAALQNATGQAAAVLCQGWANLQNRERTVYLRGEEPSGPGQRVNLAQAQSAQPPRGREEADLGRVRPFLEVHCLGQFQLYRQGTLVTPDVFARRGALTLLKILLIHLGRRVPRDTLVELLWPEADPQAGANRLHVMVHTLRQVIEPSQRAQPLVYICRDGDSYYFNPDAPYYLDVEEFRELVSLGERWERGGDSVRAIEAYEAAAASYRGDLLEDEPYAEWCFGEREHLRLTNLDILQRLGALHAEQGALDRSIARYRQALRLEPLREENHRGLMRALRDAGRRGEALRQYQVCQEVLCRELDVAPLPETEQLYALIRGNGE